MQQCKNAVLGTSRCCCNKTKNCLLHAAAEEGRTQTAKSLVCKNRVNWIILNLESERDARGRVHEIGRLVFCWRRAYLRIIALMQAGATISGILTDYVSALHSALHSATIFFTDVGMMDLEIVGKSNGNWESKINKKAKTRSKTIGKTKAKAAKRVKLGRKLTTTTTNHDLQPTSVRIIINRTVRVELGLYNLHLALARTVLNQTLHLARVYRSAVMTRW